MGKTFEELVAALKNGGQIEVSDALKQYFEGNAKADQIVKVKSLTILKSQMQGKSIFHHEFLLIELHKFADHLINMIIRAEKYPKVETSLGESVCGVVAVQIVTDPLSLVGATEKCKIKLKHCGGIAIKDLLSDLIQHDPWNAGSTHGCWKYAHDASCKVLKRCEELPDTSAEAIKQFRSTKLKLETCSIL